jgi:hypothetical protein
MQAAPASSAVRVAPTTVFRMITRPCFVGSTAVSTPVRKLESPACGDVLREAAMARVRQGCADHACYPRADHGTYPHEYGETQ